MRALTPRHAVLLLLLGLFVVHALDRSFLIDDAYISFHYARNLVEGHGLVLNHGERVEGYSNPLWVLGLAAGMAAGIRPEWTSRATGILSGLVLLVVVWRLARRTLPVGRREGWLPLLPVAMLAAHRSFAAWATSGLETRLFSLLIVAAVWALAREVVEGPSARPWSAALLAAALWLRTDGFVPVATLFATMVLLRRGRPGRHGTLLGGVLLGAAGLLHLLRAVYYGQLFANTYYAKVPGLAFGKGIDYLALAAADYGLPLLLILALAALPRPEPGQAAAWFAAAVLHVHLLYVAAVGGDHFEFRFIDLVWPLAWVLAVCGAERLWSRFSSRVGRALTVGLVATTGVWSLAPTWRGFDSSRGPLSVEVEARLCTLWREVGLYFRDHAAPDEVLALRPVGVIPYVSRLRILDMEGLTDTIVSRRPAPPELAIPSHGKVATWEDVLVRARATYYLEHPDLRTGPAEGPEPASIVEVAGRRFALVPMRVPVSDFWLRFSVISEEAVVGDRVDPSRIRARIRPTSEGLRP